MTAHDEKTQVLISALDWLNQQPDCFFFNSMGSIIGTVNGAFVDIELRVDNELSSERRHFMFKARLGKGQVMDCTTLDHVKEDMKIFLGTKSETDGKE